MDAMLNWIKRRFDRRSTEVESPPSVSPVNYNELHAKRAASYLDLKDSTVLVVGCNHGKDCAYFVDFGAAAVCGLDVIEQVGRDYTHPDVRYLRESAEAMSLPSDTFDLVYCFATMEHIAHIDRAFEEMARVAKPGGVVYCVAAPLWESRYGHHKRLIFIDHPWIHLRMTRDEIVDFGARSGLVAEPSLAHHVDYMLSDAYFNKTPARTYVEVCNNLHGMEVISNTLSLEPDEVLSAELENELAAKGYTREALLASTHTFVARKHGKPLEAPA